MLNNLIVINSIEKISYISDIYCPDYELEISKESFLISELVDAVSGQCVINDNISYTSISDFKDKENAEKYKTLVKLINKHHTISKALEITRNYYAKADINDRNEIKNEILENEKEYYELELEIKRLEKEIRNNENKIINNK